MQSRERAGFTLIELMIVIAIVGLLASIAIPMFQRYTYRAKMSEVDLNFGKMLDWGKRYFAEHDRWPRGGGAGYSHLWAVPQAWPPGPNKRPFDPTLSDWSYVDAVPVGDLYGYYEIEAQAWPGGAYLYVSATTDLDGDGVYAMRGGYWFFANGEWEPGFSFDEAPGVY